MAATALPRRAWRKILLLGCAPLAFGCGGGDAGEGDAAALDAGAETSDGSIKDGTDGTDGATDVADSDVAPTPSFLPTVVTAELVASGPVRVKTPATWNAHLPKLVGDADWIYAVHTHFPDDVGARFAVVMRRARKGGSWVEAARVTYPHQPPGVVMDAKNRLHMVFDCLRPGTTDVTCFPGGAGTGGTSSRFYRLTFEARDGAGQLRFDAYSNWNEWTALSNGYLGIGLLDAGSTVVWAIENETWGRVVQYEDGAGKRGTVTELRRPDTYLLYPIIAGDPTGAGRMLLYAGEFDPSGGTNAGYPASTGYAGDLTSLAELFRLTPSVAMKPGEVGSYPSDVLFDAGTLWVLSYRIDGKGGCTELRRFDSVSASKPVVLPVGCLETYAKLQVSRVGTVYLLAAGAGATMRVGASVDRGATWTWTNVPIMGLPENGDVRWYGMTPVKPYTSPSLYDPDRLFFLFSGDDGAGGTQHSYVGSIALAP